ncbi:hypothetical protein KSZ_40670 [Dictyobacter formicarum]|uniref:Tyr recombinase domain-containing protein n=2 Tax=Dictyobacter formicarum TaxID=2778368 RepID=A0ABQ3VK63_9CHLR|nr:hypothetical protein KSZ_40670 [Dictyobacter formicarum]
MRRFKSDYPKHRPPAAYEVDFTWITNHQLREQIKCYFRCRLPKWEAYTFTVIIRALKPVLMLLPPDVHMGTVERSHIEALLPETAQLSEYQASRGLWDLKSMVEYMATSPSWTGPRPPRFLIWKEDIPGMPETLPRPVPPDVLDQLDLLLEQAVQAIQHNQSFARLSPTLWDAILILRYTGMRAEDLCHLKAPDEHGRNGCLDQDSDGYWWIRIYHQYNKMKRDHRIPTKLTDGVVDAIHRQRERTNHLPDHFGEHYLFRTETGILSRGTVDTALKRLAPLLKHEDQPYAISPHQFRHSVATDMIETGVDIYTVKEFLGHKSLAMTEKYIKVYLKSLKAKYDAYRVKKQHTYASEMIENQVQVKQHEGEVDGGWVEGKVGKLYLSPLPDGAGNCAHLPMHDPCPDVPHCPTCPKLRATKRHLLMWENKVKNLRLTVEALRANLLYDRARKKHEQELEHAEKVVETIQREGFWDGRIHNNQTNKN